MTYEAARLEPLLEQIAAEHGATMAQVRAYIRQPHIDRARGRMVTLMRDDRSMSWGQIASRMDRTRTNCRKIYTHHQTVRRANERIAGYYDHTHFVDEVRQRLSYLTGSDRHYDLVAELGLTAAQSILVAVLARQYPRSVASSRLIDLCEEAGIVVGWGEGVDENTLKVHVKNVRRHFEAMGLDGSVETLRPDGYRMGDSMAAWLNVRYGLAPGSSVRRPVAA